MVWVSCQGENPADRENLGPIQYMPYQGFPGYYFPYTNQEGYLSPLVAVHLQRPKSKYHRYLIFCELVTSDIIIIFKSCFIMGLVVTHRTISVITTSIFMTYVFYINVNLYIHLCILNNIIITHTILILYI